jgi:PAS domain S-box-containing protein
MTGGEPRILVVDDDESVRRVLLRILESKGFVCDGASDAAEARQHLGRSEYELVLVDLMLPGESGSSLLQYISEAHPQTALVVVSALVEPTSGDEPGLAGIYGYITKPFTSGQALVTITTSLRRRELEAEQLDQTKILERLIKERTADLRRSLERLQETETDLRRQALIFENLHDGVLIVDLSGRILDFNPGAERMFGYSKDEVMGRVPDLLRPSNAEGVTEEIVRTAIQTGRWSGELVMTRKDGSEGTFDLVVVPLKDQAGEVVGTVGVNRDVSARKRAESVLQGTVEELRRSDEERRVLVSRLVTAQEEERRRIASDIHDDSIQKMAAASMRLDMLKAANPQLATDDEFIKAQVAIGRAIDSMRHLMFELRPYVLDRDGLVPALRLHLAEESGLEGSPTYQLDGHITTEPGEETRVVLYRIAQEALINVRKHARASCVVVHLSEQEDGYLLRIKDDGAGFDTSVGAHSPEGHVGLTSMRERAEMAGGWFNLMSTPGQGTVVEFWVPAGRHEERVAV